MEDPEITPLLARLHDGPPRRSRRCPDEERLAAWVEGRLGGGARDALERHLADCAYCLGQAGFLARTAELGTPPELPAHLLASARGERRAPRFAPARHAALAAAAAILVAAGLALLLPRGGERESSARAARPDAPRLDERTVRNGVAAAGAAYFLRPGEGETVARTALLFAWRPAPEALSYTVEIVNADGDVVWAGKAAQPRLAPPPDVALSPGHPYFAWVLTRRRDGAVERSPAVGFRVAPD